MHLFVTGTDTGIGKTLVSTLLCLRLQRRYWKPIQCGTETDTEWVGRWIGQENTLPEIHRFATPASPHLAARLEGQSIDLHKVQKQIADYPEDLVLEGAGGVLVPLNDSSLMIDLLQNTKVIVVARSSLGTINHSLLTLEALRSRGIEPLAVVLNGEPSENAAAIAHYGRVRVLGPIPRLEQPSRTNLHALAHEIFPDWIFKDWIKENL